MRETWLKSNRRALLFGCIPPILLVAVGTWLAASSGAATSWQRWLGIAIVLFALTLLGMLIHQIIRPRIAYRNGRVLFFVRSGSPIAVPADVVEAFFLGQGPANLPGDIHNKQHTVNLVARLAQRHTEWADVEVKPALGKWAEGYVTIRGTWCEPLNPELVRRLNRRLKDVKGARNASGDEA
jgi:hypothetical protein